MTIENRPAFGTHAWSAWNAAQNAAYLASEKECECGAHAGPGVKLVQVRHHRGCDAYL